MKLSIKVSEGANAFKLLQDNDFVKHWTELAKVSQKVTVQQEYPFVSTWYEQYNETFKPFIICGYSEDIELVGLIPMAVSKKDNSLVFAGAWQAEYRGWLCDTSIDDLFITEALIYIKKTFDHKKWNWGWLPSGTNISWMKSSRLKEEKIFFDYKEQDSPLLAVNDEERINKIKKSKSIKNQINRFKKKGEFYIERIFSKEKAIEIFDILENQCDFRQMAANKVTPFASDPYKKSFHIRRLDFRESCHLSVLWSNGKIVAFNYGECDHNTVFLGVLGYDPTETKNSPGKLLLIFLADLIKDEGFLYLDLTPGVSEYKERFSNTTHKLYFPIVFFDKKEYIKYKIDLHFKKGIKNILARFKMDPIILKSRLSGKKDAETLDNYQDLSLDYVLYKIDCDKIISSNANFNLINQNKYEDLLSYDKTETISNKSALLSNALRKFTNDETLYSIIENNELVQYAWMTEPSKIPKHISDHLFFKFPENAILYYDIYSKNIPQNFNIDMLKMAVTNLDLHTNSNVYTLIHKEIKIPKELESNKTLTKCQSTKTI